MNIFELQNQAKQHLDRSEYSQAIALYEKCIEIDSSNRSSYWKLGLSLLLQGDELTAQFVWMSVLSQNESVSQETLMSELIQELEQQAWMNIQANHFDRANKIYDKILELDDTHAIAYFGLGIIAMQKNKLQDAIDRFQAAIGINVEFAEAYYYLGECWARKNSLPHAIENLQKAIEFKPNWLEARIELGEYFRKKGHRKAAIEYLTSAIHLDKNALLAHNSLSFCFWEEGRLDEAIVHMQKVIEIDPSEPEPYFNLAYFHREKGEIDRAISLCEQALKIHPDFTAAKERKCALINYKRSGYVPAFRYQDRTWDSILFKDREIYRLFYLSGDPKAHPFYSVGEMNAAISSDLQTWEYLGVALKPNPQNRWESGRILAGNLYQENGKYYLFYSASPPDPDLFQESISLATSVDGISWKRFSEKPIALDSRFYSHSTRQVNGVSFKHQQFRDPYIFKDDKDGKYHLFFSCASNQFSSSFNACIGRAVAERIEGPYEMLPPAVLPFLPGTREGIYYEMERPQIIKKYNRYHLFFSASPLLINPKWIEEVGRENITMSSLYWYVADNLTDSFQPSREQPIVCGSEKTGLYGTQLVEGLDGDFFACGCYFDSMTLEVSPRFSVRWEEETMEIYDRADSGESCS